MHDNTQCQAGTPARLHGRKLHTKQSCVTAGTATTQKLTSLPPAALPPVGLPPAALLRRRLPRPEGSCNHGRAHEEPLSAFTGIHAHAFSNARSGVYMCTHMWRKGCISARHFFLDTAHRSGVLSGLIVHSPIIGRRREVIDALKLVCRGWCTNAMEKQSHHDES